MRNDCTVLVMRLAPMIGRPTSALRVSVYHRAADHAREEVVSRLSSLRTLGDVQVKPRAVTKPATKLDRAIARKAARLEDAQKLRVWAKAVKERDEWKDRKTGVRVRSTRDLDPLRAEAHHIEPRENRAVRYDIRNGICLSFATHYAVEKCQLRIDGTAWFVKDGCRYIDGTQAVIFVRL